MKTCGPRPPKSGPRRKVTANKIIITNIAKCQMLDPINTVIPDYFGSVQISVVFENSISVEILFR